MPGSINSQTIFSKIVGKSLEHMFALFYFGFIFLKSESWIGLRRTNAVEAEGEAERRGRPSKTTTDSRNAVTIYVLPKSEMSNDKRSKLKLSTFRYLHVRYVNISY
jgi:hypothetical protein